jgi:formiminoglutamase
MSGGSSNTARWYMRLDPVEPPRDFLRRPDDPRLGEVTEFWKGGPPLLAPGRPVLIGFPQDEGVRRNGGRPGAAEAPQEIRRWLYRMAPWDCQADVQLANPALLDLGNVGISEDLEAAQAALGEVVTAVLASGAMPIVLGGGHETAYGHFLGYAAAGRKVGIINIDAHLDLRPLLEGKGHSGSPFRQALDHPSHALAGEYYVCLGAQPHSVSRQHWLFARDQGCTVRWGKEVENRLEESFLEECGRLAQAGCRIYASIDADAIQASEVPGVSAPNVMGLPGAKVAACARLAGSLPHVSSLDLVEINPRFDRDGQSARWAALVVWSFLAGLASRGAHRSVNR